MATIKRRLYCCMATNHRSRRDVRAPTVAIPTCFGGGSEQQRQTMGGPGHGRGGCPKEQTMLSRNPRLLTPGPLALAPEVKASMQSDLGSRDIAFRQVTRDIRQWIQELAGAGPDYSTIPIQGSGTFAIEAALTTFIKDSD